MKRGRRPGPLRTECAKGHPMSGANLYVHPTNSRYQVCRTCGAEKARLVRRGLFVKQPHSLAPSSYASTNTGDGRIKSTHVVIVERLIGPLPQGAQVHHVDGDRHNNSRSNLVVCQDRAYHALLHVRANAMKTTGRPDLRKCVRCKKWDEPSNMRHHSHNTLAHRECNNAAERARKERRAAASVLASILLVLSLSCTPVSNGIPSTLPLSPTPTPHWSHRVEFIKWQMICWQHNFYRENKPTNPGNEITLTAGKSYYIQVVDADNEEVEEKHGVPTVSGIGYKGGKLIGHGEMLPPQLITPMVPGDYPFGCTNFCGSGHDEMTGVFHVR